MARKITKPVNPVEGLTPKDIAENTSHYFDAYGRMTMTVFGLPLQALNIDSMRGDEKSIVHLTYAACSLAVFHCITNFFGLTPKMEGYRKCDTSSLHYLRKYMNHESNQHIHISLDLSRWDIPEQDKEAYDKLLEVIYSNDMEGVE